MSEKVPLPWRWTPMQSRRTWRRARTRQRKRDVTRRFYRQLLGGRILSHEEYEAGMHFATVNLLEAKSQGLTR